MIAFIYMAELNGPITYAHRGLFPHPLDKVVRAIKSSNMPRSGSGRNIQGSFYGTVTVGYSFTCERFTGLCGAVVDTNGSVYD